ncbi:hypothetical protein KQ302_07370 [Synechococcus sp. CS-602]|uniref:hypothetical protein n=1 Tax=Synechococcaceae TaxID=1890426 RepID=UPI000A8BF0F0|nr:MULTISPECIES: hypothetical protein [Synechococcaceae]MCT0200989.1 hypothetical protein [Synechococcus sp. CS-603]MCT0204918.1 hypothetical protein [Synechococcus sp. CS-602]MCT0244746.1 hypothetical protein [Synechococcus sp. CS-601]MCT4367578.1 hypothetical protein [Candidatus Regnicoccus frigidus MAG-AL2]
MTMTKDNTLMTNAKQVLSDKERQAYFEQQQARLDEWTAELEKLKAKASYQSASAKQAVLEKIDQQLDTLQEARSFVHSKLLNVQEASSDQWNQLVEESDHLLSQLSEKVKGFMDDINGSPTDGAANQQQDQA